MGLYYGIAIALFLYNLFLFISIRDSSYLFYVCYVLFITISVFTLDGAADYYLPGKTFHWIDYLNHFAYTGVIFALIFSRKFLETKKNLRTFDYAIQFLIGASILGLLASFFLPYMLHRIFIDLVLLVGGLTLVSTGCVAVWRGVRAARFYLVSWIALICSIILWLTYSYGLIGRNPLYKYSVHLGAAFEMVFLSLALADRIKALDFERQRAEGREKENRVVVQTMQMIAHDVRKPFTFLTMMLDELQSTNVPASMRAVTQ